MEIKHIKGDWAGQDVRETRYLLTLFRHRLY
jgi:hypothetical protein